MRAKEDSMFVIGWNVWIGHKPSDVRNTLSEVLPLNDVELAVLTEATRLKDHLEDLGYEVIQLAPRPKRKGNQPGDANVAILVRSDLVIRRRKALRMKTFWKGPKHGLPQDPRVHRAIWVKRPGSRKVIKVCGAHVPFGSAARSETVRRLVEWGKKTMPGRPTILILDANMRLPEFRQKVSDPAGMKADGQNIDLAAYKNVRLISKKDLGKNGSDHPAMLYEFDLS